MYKSIKVKVIDLKEFTSIMTKKGFTQRSLAKASAVSVARIHSLLKKGGACGPSVAFRLYRTLGVDFDDLFLSILLTTVSESHDFA